MTHQPPNPFLRLSPELWQRARAKINFFNKQNQKINFLKNLFLQSPCRKNLFFLRGAPPSSTPIATVLGRQKVWQPGPKAWRVGCLWRLRALVRVGLWLCPFDIRPHKMKSTLLVAVMRETFSKNSCTGTFAFHFDGLPNFLGARVVENFVMVDAHSHQRLTTYML